MNDDLKLNKSPQNLMLRELETRGCGQVKRAWNDEDQNVFNNTYFWKCPRELLPSHSFFGLFLRGKQASNKNAVMINTAAQALLWSMVLTTKSGMNIGLKALLPLSALEIAINRE